MKLINKHKYDKAIVDMNSETFVIHIAVLEAAESAGNVIYLFWLSCVLIKAIQLVIL